MVHTVTLDLELDKGGEVFTFRNEKYIVPSVQLASREAQAETRPSESNRTNTANLRQRGRHEIALVRLRICPARFRKRMPKLPPFSSMNSTSALSSARINFARLSEETSGPKPPSTRLTVGNDRRRILRSAVLGASSRTAPCRQGSELVDKTSAVSVAAQPSALVASSFNMTASRARGRTW
jgi:hypothetical protein